MSATSCGTTRARRSERNPSFNRRFLEIALWACDPALVRDRLVAHLGSGDPIAVRGVVNARYWTGKVGVDVPVAELARCALSIGERDLRRSLIGAVRGKRGEARDAGERELIARVLALPR